MTMRLFWVAALLALIATGCTTNTSFNNTHFACTDGRCPSGYQCLQGFCESLNSDAGLADATPDAMIDYAALCDQQFGAAPAYVLCNANPPGTDAGGATCDFYTTTNGGTCNDLCDSLGATCVHSWDADQGTECTRKTEGDCTIALNDQDCICALPM